MADMGDILVNAAFKGLKKNISFRPEFLNRIDEIIMFSPLTIPDMEKIVDLQMKEIQDRLGDYGVKVDDSGIEFKTKGGKKQEVEKEENSLW